MHDSHHHHHHHHHHHPESLARDVFEEEANVELVMWAAGAVVEVFAPGLCAPLLV
jgi:hypothetical protein